MKKLLPVFALIGACSHNPAKGTAEISRSSAIITQTGPDNREPDNFEERLLNAVVKTLVPFRFTGVIPEMSVALSVNIEGQATTPVFRGVRMTASFIDRRGDVFTANCQNLKNTEDQSLAKIATSKSLITSRIEQAQLDEIHTAQLALKCKTAPSI